MLDFISGFFFNNSSLKKSTHFFLLRTLFSAPQSLARQHHQSSSAPWQCEPPLNPVDLATRGAEWQKMSQKTPRVDQSGNLIKQQGLWRIDSQKTFESCVLGVLIPSNHLQIMTFATVIIQIKIWSDLNVERHQTTDWLTYLDYF